MAKEFKNSSDLDVKFFRGLLSGLFTTLLRALVIVTFVSVVFASCGGPSSVRSMLGLNPEQPGDGNDLGKLQLISGGVVVSRSSDQPVASSSVVALSRQSGDGKYKVFCTGTLISRTHVLTAAHCLDGISESELTKGALLLYVRFGFGPDAEAEVEDSAHEKGVSLVRVKRALRHPQYDENLPTNEQVERPPNDLAILTLSKDAPAHYFPARIPVKAYALPESFMIAGYGVSQSRYQGDTGTLRTATITRQRLRSERQTFETVGGSFFEPIGGCAGDSGAPVIQGGNAVFGVLSTGAEVNGKCIGTNVFTDVRYYTDWISERLAAEGQSPLLLDLSAASSGVSFDTALFRRSLKEVAPKLAVALSHKSASGDALKNCKLTLNSQSRVPGTSAIETGLIQEKWVSSEFELAADGGILFQFPGLKSEPVSYSVGVELNCDKVSLSVSPPVFVF